MIRWDQRNETWRWEFDRRIDGRRLRRSRLLPKALTKEQAEVIGAKMEAEEFVRLRLVRAADGWDAYVDEQLASRGSWLHRTIAGCKHRSAKKGRSCSLSADELAAIMRRSRGRCEVTGLEFQFHKGEDARARPLFHSLDRRDASEGYSTANCRLVCYAVNLAMSNWGEDVFAQIATGFVINRYCAIGISQEAFSAGFPRTLRATG